MVNVCAGNPITLFTVAYDLALNFCFATTSVMLLFFQQDVFWEEVLLWIIFTSVILDT